MKNYLILLVVILCLYFSCSVSAVDEDWSKYSDEEIVSIHDSLEMEMSSRGLGNIVVLEPGNYVAGKDFPAGRYSIKNVSEEFNFINYCIYVSEESYNTNRYDPMEINTVWKSEGNKKIDLDDGQVFLFERGFLRISKAPMLFQ